MVLYVENHFHFGVYCTLQRLLLPMSSFTTFIFSKIHSGRSLKFESLANNLNQRSEIGANTAEIYDVSNFELIKYALRKIVSFLTVLKVHKGNLITP